MKKLDAWGIVIRQFNVRGPFGRKEFSVGAAIGRPGSCLTQDCICGRAMRAPTLIRIHVKTNCELKIVVV